MLDIVGELATVPKTKHSTTKMVAEFYRVEPIVVNNLRLYHGEEIDSVGVRYTRHQELKDGLFELVNGVGEWKQLKDRIGE